MHKSDIDEYRKAIEYLKTIGLSLMPSIYWITDKRGLYSDYHKIKDYISENGKQYVNSIMDFSKSEDDAYYCPDEDYDEYIEMRSLPVGETKWWCSEIIKPSDITKKEDTNYITLIDDYHFEIQFKIKYKDSFIGLMSLPDVRIFLKHIDALCKASIESLLLAGDFLPIK